MILISVGFPELVITSAFHWATVCSQMSAWRVPVPQLNPHKPIGHEVLPPFHRQLKMGAIKFLA